MRFVTTTPEQILGSCYVEKSKELIFRNSSVIIVAQASMEHTKLDHWKVNQASM